MKTFIFDIDNTLYSYDKAHKVAFEALCAYAWEHFGLDGEAFLSLHKKGNALLRSHVGADCAAVHNRLIRYQIMMESIGQPIAHAPMMSELYWSTLLSHMEAEPGALELLKVLKQSGYTIGIGTDMTADYQFQKLTLLGLLPYIDFMVTSEEAGAEKPNQRLFALCAEKARCTPEECVFIGDSLKKDVLGSKNAGMQAVWYHPGPEPIPDLPNDIHVIRTLSEVTALFPAR